MPARRETTTTRPTPLEETEPTAPAPEAPSPAEPDPSVPDGPTAEELDLEARVRHAVDEAFRSRPNMGALLGGFAQAQREDYPLTVHEAIAEVTRRVDAIAKDRTASQGGSYRYRGIDDVFSALHPLLADVGLVIMPGRVVESVWETRATSSGGTLNVARLRVRYRLVGPDGSTLTGEAWGEGGDSGDKATQKAHSQSYKSFTLQLFSIPTEDSQRDEPDATNPPSRPFTGQEVDRAERAYAAALDAPDLPHLVTVRQRALELLGVPVTGTGGALAPLSYWLEERRLELVRTAEGAQQ